MPDTLDPKLAARPTVRRQLATMLAFAVMPAVIFSIADGVRRYHRVADERAAAFLSDAIVDAQATRDMFVGLRAVAGTLALDGDVAGFRAPQCARMLAQAVAANPAYLLAVAVDAAGAPRCASRPLPDGLHFGDDAAFAAIAAAPAFDLTVQQAGRVSGQEVLIGTAPIEAEGAFGGVVAISVATSSLRFLTAGEADPTARRPFRAIVGPEGEVLVNSAEGEGEGRLGWLPTDGLAGRLGRTPASFTGMSADGAERSYAVSPFVRERAWLVAGSEPAAVFDEATLRVLPAIVTPLLMLAIAVGVAYFALDRLVVQHLVYLARLTRAYGRGRLDLRPQAAETAPQELASLTQSLGAMAESLDTRQRELRESAETNRVLLLEVHHRVRNNLQMVASLLNLQMRETDEEVERITLERIRARIHSLALVHEKLHEGDAVDRLDLARLLGDVARGVVDSRAHGPGPRPTLALDLDGRIESSERATPLALFLNEAVIEATNAAAASGRPEVKVTLRAAPDGALSLRVENDAQGEEPERGALGARLMEGFARQLRARLRRAREGDRHVVELALDGPPAPAPAA